MKNKTLIIILIILLTAIIVGLIALLGFCLTGNFSIMMGIVNSQKSTNIIADEKYNLEGIKNIDISADSENIIFKQSTDEQIRVVAYGQNDEDCKIELNNSELEIVYKRKNQINWIFFNNYSNDIVVYIPSDYSDKININSQYGNCEMIDLEYATLNIDADCGNVKLGKIKNATIKCDYGNIDIDAILNKCDIESDCGNVTIDSIQIEEDSYIKSDLRKCNN